MSGKTAHRAKRPFHDQKGRAAKSGLNFYIYAAVTLVNEKIRKTLRGRFAAVFLFFAFAGCLWTSCSEEQLFPGNARLKTAFRLTSSNALGGSITIQEAYLKLEGITVTGSVGNGNAPDANYPVPIEDPPYRLTQGDTARVSLTLPRSAYDQMDLHLFLLQTDYKLIVHQKTSEETPPPVNNGNDESTGGVADPNNGSPADDDSQNDGEQGADGDQPDEAGDQDGDDDGGGEEDDEDDGRDNQDEGERADDDDDHDNGDHKKGDKDDKKGKDDKKDKDGQKGKGDDKDEDDDNEDDEDDDDDRDDDDGDNDRTSGNEINGTVDLDHFFQHAKPSLVVFATWSFNGQDINLIFAVTDVERITIRATQNGGAQIRVDEHGQGIVNFDPERWFQSISANDLQNASLQSHQGRPVMFIHKAVNTGLFETLLNNLTASTTFEVTTSSDQ